MATERNVVDFKIHNLTEEQFQELKAQGKIDPNAVYCTPDTTKERLDALEENKQDKGDYATNTALSQGLAQKQDIATAVNYDNITNCITKIPQDIKLELNNGTLTLKAGSTVYVPNGTGVFDIITTKNDLTVTASTNGTHLVGLAQGFGSLAVYINAVSSATEPTLSNGLTWYDTANNVIKRAWGGSWQNSLFSFPFAIITVSGGAISSIDQIFNGFGYIGSTMFILPGVSVLIPDGLKEDGSLKNRTYTTTGVSTRTNTDTGNGIKQYLLLRNDGSMFQANAFYEQEEKPGFVENQNQYWYNPATNRMFYYRSSSQSNFINDSIIVASFILSGTKIDKFTPNNVFHAVDYSDLEELDNSVNAKFLPLAGGTMTGAIIHKGYLAAIQKDTNDTSLDLLSGVDLTKGATLRLYGKDYNLIPGAFTLSAGNGSKSIYLTGKPDGTLTWNGNQLATMPNYSAGVAFTLNKSTSYTAPKDGFVFILTGRANDQVSSIAIDGTIVAATISNWSNIPYFFPVASGTVVSTSLDTISTAIFYPLKGAI